MQDALGDFIYLNYAQCVYAIDQDGRLGPGLTVVQSASITTAVRVNKDRLSALSACVREVPGLCPAHAFTLRSPRLIGIVVLCAAPPEALAPHSPSQMPLSCLVPLIFQRERELHKDGGGGGGGGVARRARAARAPKARSCATSSATPCAASFRCSSFTCRPRVALGAACVCWAWVPPLEDGACQDEHLHAPILCGAWVPPLGYGGVGRGVEGRLGRGPDLFRGRARIRVAALHRIPFLCPLECCVGGGRPRV